jgi:hypothetical protein
MGRMNIVVDDVVDTEFRNSLPSKKKGDISKRIELLMRKDLKKKDVENRVENTKIKNLFLQIDKMILKFYNCEDFSMNAANKVAFEFDKIKQKVNKK